MSYVAWIYSFAQHCIRIEMPRSVTARYLMKAKTELGGGKSGLRLSGCYLQETLFRVAEEQVFRQRKFSTLNEWRKDYGTFFQPSFPLPSSTNLLVGFCLLASFGSTPLLCLGLAGWVYLWIYWNADFECRTKVLYFIAFSFSSQWLFSDLPLFAAKAIRLR